MFRKFFADLSALTANAEALAASIEEANLNFRANLGLDHADVPEQLEYEPALPKNRKKTN